jgi:hypothetical protein
MAGGVCLVDRGGDGNVDEKAYTSSVSGSAADASGDIWASFAALLFLYALAAGDSVLVFCSSVAADFLDFGLLGGSPSALRLVIVGMKLWVRSCEVLTTRMERQR